MTDEVAAKLTRLRALLGPDLEAIVLRSPGMVAWLSGGGRSYIVPGDVGVAAVIVTAAAVTVVTTVNEMPKLETEELSALDADWKVLPWTADLTSAFPNHRCGTDVAFGDARVMTEELAAVRRSLLPEEVERFVALGRDAAEVMTDVGNSVTPTTTEFAIAGGIAGGLWERGIDHLVMLVCGGDRLALHRHPLPTGGPAGDLVLMVTCARRHGLIASITRLVATGPLPAELADRYARLARVDVAYNAATVPGAVVGEVFAAGAGAYAENGFPDDEWTQHTQGGPSGYAIRDYVATTANREVVADLQPFAWNPTAISLKFEDAMLATADGPRFVTSDPRWPTIDVDGLTRPDILVR